MRGINIIPYILTFSKIYIGIEENLGYRLIHTVFGPDLSDCKYFLIILEGAAACRVGSDTSL